MKIRAYPLKELEKRKRLRIKTIDLEKLATIVPQDIDYSVFTNQTLLHELETVYNKALKSLELEDHDSVWDVFKVLFEQDLETKEKIAQALMPQEEGDTVSEEELQELIELQGFYSNFRIRLLEEVSSLLVDIYEQASKMVSMNLNEGGRLAQKAQNFFKVYTVRLKHFEAPIDEYKGKMFMECTGTLEVVKISGERNLKEMTEAVLAKEKEVKEQGEKEAQESKNLKFPPN